MANATLTSATLSLPRQNHVGMFAQLFHFDYNGVSISVSNQILLGWVQPNVTILDAYIWGSDGNAGTSTFKIGTLATDNAIAGATTLSAGIMRPPLFAPVILSLSADAEGNLRVPICLTKSVGTSTVTGSLNLMLILQSPPV